MTRAELEQAVETYLDTYWPAGARHLVEVVQAALERRGDEYMPRAAASLGEDEELFGLVPDPSEERAVSMGIGLCRSRTIGITRGRSTTVSRGHHDGTAYSYNYGYGESWNQSETTMHGDAEACGSTEGLARGQSRSCGSSTTHGEGCSESHGQHDDS